MPQANPLHPPMTAERLRDLVSYNLETGEFTLLKSSKAWRRGRILRGGLDRDGYRLLILEGKSYRAHRLVWLYVYGQPPDGQIDHINGVRDDNRIANLRIASPSQNMWNSRRPKNNRSGFKGVSWNARDERWQAQIKVNSRSIALGTFRCPEEAARAYQVASVKYHGAFARPE